MNGLCHQIFSGPTLSQDEDGGIAARYQLRHVVHALHGA